MSQLIQNPPFTGTASADLTGKEAHFVKPTSTGWALAGNGEFGLPLVQGAASGRPISIAPVGNVHYVVAGAQVTKGARVKSDADGKCRDVAATSVSGAAVVGSFANGIALEGGATGVMIPVLVLPIGTVATTAA